MKFGTNFLEQQANGTFKVVRIIPKKEKIKHNKVPVVEKPDFFQLLIKQNFNLDCIRELEFHPERKFRFDYAIPSLKIAFEVEGGIFGDGKKCPVCNQAKNGGHSSITGILRDMEKYNEAQLLGWKVFRLLPDELNKIKPLDIIKKLKKMEINKIYNEDCLILMAKMPDNFIDLTVTSPPYDDLRTYNGYSFDFKNGAFTETQLDRE